MARTGRPRKPPHQLTGHRTRAELAARRLPLRPPPGRPFVPEAPLTAGGTVLGDRALDAWTAFWLSPVARALDGPNGVDRLVVEEWVRAFHELEVLERLVETARLVQGSKKQLRPSPLVGQRDEARRVVWHCQEKLGLTPTDRARLGLEIGEEALTAAKLNEELDRITARRQQEGR